MIYFIIGYMASGKTTFAKQMSLKYKMPYIDTDELIEKLEEQPISDIFKNDGETYFRWLELDLLIKIINEQKTDVIVSCGGGMPIYNGCMDIMNENGVTIYLKTPISVIYNRLTSEELEKRPLLKDKSKDEILNIILNDLEKREFIYNKANIIINDYETINNKWPKFELIGNPRA